MSETATVHDPMLAATADTSDAIYASLREIDPVHWSRRLGGWVLTRHADVMAGLRDPALSADNALARVVRIGDRGGPPLPNFRSVISAISFLMAEPQHDQVRRFLSKVFQALEVARLRPLLEARALFLLEAGREAGEIDLATGFGRDLALYMLHLLLGVPLNDCQALAGMAREVTHFFDQGPKSLRHLIAADAEVGVLLRYFENLVADRRRCKGDDGLSKIIVLARSELGVDDEAIVGYCAFFFVAGEETTATSIARASVSLAAQPALRARLASSPNLVPAAAKEFLRLVSSFQYVTRIATRDCVFGGKTVRAGQSVNLVLAAANRDPMVFPDPDEIVLDRNGPESIAFGYGAFRCLGAGMATMEIEAAVAALSKFPDLRLVPDTVVSAPRLRIPALATARAVFEPADAPAAA